VVGPTEGVKLVIDGLSYLKLVADVMGLYPYPQTVCA